MMTNTLARSPVIACALLLLFAFPLASRGQYQAVISVAGGISSSTSYSLRSTLGEPIPGSVASSASYRLTTGFYKPSPGTVDVAGPTISTPVVDPSAAIEGDAVTIRTQIVDTGSGVATAVVRYGIGGASSTQQCILSAEWGGVFSCDIDAASVGSRGLRFQIEATDNSGNPSSFPAIGSIDIPVNTTGDSFTISAGQSAGAYRLVSAPLELATRSVSSLIPGISSDRSEWRLFELNSNYVDDTDCTLANPENCYREFSTTSTLAMSEGSSYFVISKGGGEVVSGSGRTVSTVEPYAIPLHKGWNLIGNPFNFPIPRSRMTIGPTGTLRVQRFAGSWADATQLDPFGGVSVDGDEGGLTLTIDPDASTGKDADKYEGAEPHSFAPEWAIHIQASSGDVSDTGNYAGVHREANEAWDLFDAPEPLLFGDYLSVSFPHQEWGRAHRLFASDIRRMEEDGLTWELWVVSATSRLATLTFSHLESVPSQLSIQLVDQTTGQTQDLRANPEYSLMTMGQGRQQPLLLLVGKGSYVENQLDGLDVVPETHTLDQNYPNPFNPSTSIRFGITEDALVSLDVYNLLGQHVASLADHTSRTAGYYVAVWDARSDDGSPVASGIYVYHLRVTPLASPASAPSVLTKKMLLIK